LMPQKRFGVTGIDLAGPLYIKVGSNMRKGYIALFICAATRAFHLDLCANMSTDKYLLALQRFVGRRGLPHTVYTDNAQTFHATDKYLALLWSSLFAAKSHHCAGRKLGSGINTSTLSHWGETNCNTISTTAGDEREPNKII
jgi:hypothetical protein